MQESASVQQERAEEALPVKHNMFASLHGSNWKDERFSQFKSNPVDKHKWREVPSTALPEGRPATVDVPPEFGVKVDPGFGGAESKASEMILPPNHTLDSFQAFRRDLQIAVGSEWIEEIAGRFYDGDYTNPSIAHDAQALFSRNDLVGSLLVYPGSVEDVQSIVKLANKHIVPLWVCSIGRNLGYGGAAPRLRGSVILYLGKRMNKVEEVNEKLAYCRVQPGVSYMDLYEHLHKIGLGNKLWIDVPDLSGGSVLGNAMDRGVGYTPYGDHFANHCGMEIVLPDGELLRTGPGAMPNSKTWHIFEHSLGPTPDGLFCQGNFGICVSIGMKLMPNPGGILPFLITFPKLQDLAAITETTRPLMLNHVIGNVPMLLGLGDLAFNGNKSDFYSGEGAIPEEEIQRLTDKYGTGRWAMYACVYGPPMIANMMWEAIKHAYGNIEGARFYTREELPDWSTLHDRARIFAGVPNWRTSQILDWIPNSGELWFSPVLPAEAQSTVSMNAMVREILAKYGFDDLGSLFFGIREVHYVVPILYDRENPEAKDSAIACCRELIDRAAAEGYSIYRSHLIFQDQISSSFSYNDNALNRFYERLKDTLDPLSIIQPGRNGIWGTRWKNKGWELKGGEKHSDPRARDAQPPRSLFR